MASMGADEPPTPPVRPRVLPLSSMLSSADHQPIKKIHTYKGGEEPPVKSPRRSDRIAARRSGAPLVREPSISTPVCRVGASARPYITREPPTMTPQNYTTKGRRLKIRTLRKKRRLKTPTSLITSTLNLHANSHYIGFGGAGGIARGIARGTKSTANKY